MNLFTLTTIGIALAANSASSTTTSSDGLLTVTGHDGHARHMHGGDAAQLGHVEMTVRWDGDDATVLTAERVVALRGHDCEAPPEAVDTLAVGGLFVAGMAESALSLPLSPHSVQRVTVGFPAVSAYTSHCDRFAFEVHFRTAAGAAAVATAEVLVVRVEPLRTPR